MQPIFGLVEDDRVWVVDGVAGNFVADVAGHTVHYFCLWRVGIDNFRVKLIGREGSFSSFEFFGEFWFNLTAFSARGGSAFGGEKFHIHPSISVNVVGAFQRFFDVKRSFN